jgi:hypothetical protein
VTAQSPPEAGEPTEEYKNAWASIQAMVMNDGASWSGREKNCVYLNTGERVFANASSISRADYPDDARAVASVDWDDDGRMDVIVKNRTAPRIRFLRNQAADSGHFLKLDLVGTTSNRDAIGATVVVDLGERQLRKTLFGGDGYLSQSSKRLHFGLADAERAVRITVKWPAGEEEVFEDVAGDARYRIVQGAGALEPVAARTHADFAKHVPVVEQRLDESVGRIVLVDRLPMVPVTIPSFDKPDRKIKEFAGGPLLLNLWETTCAACIGEFGEFRKRRKEIKASGLRIATATLDEGPKLAEARRILKTFGLSEHAGYVDGRLKNVLEVCFVEVLGKSDGIPLPASLLIDKAGQLVAIYHGAVDVDQLLEDVAVIEEAGTHTRNVGLSGGLWFKRGNRELNLISQVFKELGRERLATYYEELYKRQ